MLLHRPYDSFTAIIELLHAAATDPAVVAIKQTLYQTDEDSPVIDKLVLAALNGKQVTVVIELQARFEEKRNIAMAARLHDAGAQVVYGLVGIQAHAKMCIVVRAEERAAALRPPLDRQLQRRHGARLHRPRPAHGQRRVRAGSIAAHERADRLLREQPGAGAGPDAGHRAAGRSGSTSSSRRSTISARSWPRSIARPKHAKEKKPARITAKLNSLVDPVVIDALYRAADAGVKIDLIVRAICSLVPRENIRVISIVDRFLEHSRVIRFENAGAPEIVLSSGDWMPRNFVRRVEVMFPLLDANVRERAEKILEISLADGASSWELQPDGTWTPRRGGVVEPAEVHRDHARRGGCARAVRRGDRAGAEDPEEGQEEENVNCKERN